MPADYIEHLDHRITALLTLFVRNDAGFDWTGKGDLYRASLEASSIMLRALIEFLGVKSDRKNPGTLTVSKRGAASKGVGDDVLGVGNLAVVPAVDPKALGTSLERLIAGAHDGAAKRSAHAVFASSVGPLDPGEHRRAVKWVVSEIWNRCYDPDPIVVHPDLFGLLQGGAWEGIPFAPTR